MCKSNRIFFCMTNWEKQCKNSVYDFDHGIDMTHIIAKDEEDAGRIYELYLKSKNLTPNSSFVKKGYTVSEIIGKTEEEILKEMKQNV